MISIGGAIAGGARLTMATEFGPATFWEESDAMASRWLPTRGPCDTIWRRHRRIRENATRLRDDESALKTLFL